MIGFGSASLLPSGRIASLLVAGALFLISGCVSGSLSERTFLREIPTAQDAVGDDLALVTFSADKKYESERGVPLEGDPLICRPEGFMRVNSAELIRNQIYVKGGEEIAVATMIKWYNTGWTKTCWPFVTFTPESGATYVVVNERIGGKGASFLWTGIAFQHCEVSVFRLDPSGARRIEIRETLAEACQPEAQ